MLPPMRVLGSLVVLLGCIGGCGGGGGSRTPGSSVIVFSAPTQPVAGLQLLIVDAPAPVLVAERSYSTSWSSPAGASALVPASAVTSGKIAMLAPALAPGRYEIEIDLGSAKGRFAVDLTSTPVAADPAATVATFQSGLAGLVASLQTVVATSQNAELQGSLTADLANVTFWQQQVAGAVQGLTAAETAMLANFIEANPRLRSLGAASATDGEAEYDPRSALQQAKQTFISSGPEFVAGVALVGVGLLAVGTPGLQVPGAIAIAAGLGLAAVTASDMFQAARLGARAVGDLAIGSSSPLSGGHGLPPFGLQGGGQLTLSNQVGIPLVGNANFASLTEADRGNSDPDVRAFFASYDVVETQRLQLGAGALGLLRTQPGPLPASAAQSTQRIDLSRVTIVAQSNPQVLLTLVDGTLTGSLQGASASASTTATFRYDEGALGVLTRTLEVEVVASLGATFTIDPITGSCGSITNQFEAYVLSAGFSGSQGTLVLGRAVSGQPSCVSIAESALLAVQIVASQSYEQGGVKYLTYSGTWQTTVVNPGACSQALYAPRQGLTATFQIFGATDAELRDRALQVLRSFYLGFCSI